MSKYDPSIWFQISRKYRTVARLPQGMTGIEALKTLNVREEAWAENMGEGNAGDHYLRCRGHVIGKELTREEWDKFKADGGTTYMAYAFDQKQSKIQSLVQRMIRLGIVNPSKTSEAENMLMQMRPSCYNG